MKLSKKSVLRQPELVSGSNSCEFQNIKILK